MLTLQRERSVDLWPEIMPLLIEHKEEIAHYQDIELDPDTDAYSACEMLGDLRCYTARMDGWLIGYAIFFLKMNIHYKQSPQAFQDVLFVMKRFRKGRIGLKLIGYATEQLKAEGIQVEYQHVKAGDQIREALAALPDRTDVGALMERLGYELVDLIYAKRLDK